MAAAQTNEKLKQIVETQGVLVSTNFDLPAFMQEVTKRMQALTPATGAVVELVEGEEMVYRAASGSVAPFVGLRLKMKGSLSGRCVHEREIMISEDTSQDVRVDKDACKRVGAGSMIVVPLFKLDQAVGVLKVVSLKPKVFKDEDMQTLQLMAGLLGGALGQQIELDHRRKLEDQLRHMAQFDNLTELPNRALFNDRLSRAILASARNKTTLALMYMDIDHFKSVNDTYGHDAGDALLKEFSKRVGVVVREVDTFARLGGDEFTLIAENLRSPRDVEETAVKICNEARREFPLGGKTLQVSASIGIAVSSGTKVDADQFVKRADSALYKAKLAGRDCYKMEDSPASAAQ